MFVLKHRRTYFAIIIFVCLCQMTVEAKNCKCACNGLSLKGNSVCTLYHQVNNERYNISNRVSSRTRYIRDLNNLSQKVRNQHQLILNFTRKPSTLISENKKDNVNGTWRDILNIDEEINNITSFLKRLDVENVVRSKIETMMDTLLKNEIKDLSDQFDGVLYKEDMKTLNERLDSMENKLSSLIDSKLISQISDAIESFRLDLESLNASVYENIQSGQAHQSKMEEHNAAIKVVGELKTHGELLNNTIAVYQYEFSELEKHAKYLGQKAKNAEKALANLVVESFKNEKQKTINQMKTFKADWISNCSRGLMPCFLLPKSPRFSDFDSGLSNSNNLNIDEGEYFFGCTPIYEKDYPYLQITRNEDSTLTFSCTEDRILIGAMHILCSKGDWIPDVPPKCVLNL